MAQRTQVILVDDIDGSEATQTVTFGIDGVTYKMKRLMTVRFAN